MSQQWISKTETSLYPLIFRASLYIFNKFGSSYTMAIDLVSIPAYRFKRKNIFKHNLYNFENSVYYAKYYLCLKK